ncbi:MAG: site-specific integrase [Oscillospiraceae bacterium]|nr:site-specific integrase [Oscillospiraceae bacterium]
MKLGKITAMHLEEFYKNLAEVISETTGRPLSPQTIKHHHRCISATLADATKKQVISRNVASREFLDAPATPKKEPAHLDDEQARQFVGLLLCEDDLRKKAAFSLLLLSGCCIGELTGLEWTDIDFERQTISIRRSGQYISGRGVFTKTPKNDTSARTIKLPATAFTILHEYRRWYSEQRLMLGSKWENSNRLFINTYGAPITPNIINRWFDSFIKTHSLPRITPHGLRHTNLTLLISNGIDLRTVVHKAGHSRTSTTSDIYAHAIQSADERASQVLDSVLVGNGVG